VETENFQPAVKLINEMLKTNPEMEQLWTLQAGIFLQLNQLDKAAVNFEMLRKIGKANAKNLMALGDIYMMMDAGDLALSAYLEGVEKEETGQRSGSLRAAGILVNRSAWSEAQTLLHRVESVRQGDMDEETRAQLRALKARVALGQRQSERAAEILQSMVAADPLHGEALLMLGDLHAGEDQFAEAENRYKLAMEIEGFEAEAMVKLAQLYVRRQKYQLAVEQLRKAQSIRPKENIQEYLEKVEEAALRSGRAS
jgi:tetratricopeptide (TPR) repeat protein